MSARAIASFCMVLTIVEGCERQPSVSARPPATLDARPPLDPHPPRDARTAEPADSGVTVRGLTHEQLLAIYYPDGGDAALVVRPGEPLPPDTAWDDDEPVAVSRSTWSIGYPDERSSITSERTLRIDVATERARAAFVGSGTPVPPGTIVAARADAEGFATVSVDGAHYATLDANGLRRAIVGTVAPPNEALSLHPSATGWTVTRGANSLTVTTEPRGAPQPLACELFVAMLLGGDASVIRRSCAAVRAPTRVALRAGGNDAWVFERRDMLAIRLPRRSLAMPASSARADTAPRMHAPDGAFFAPSELARLGGTRALAHTLSVDNRSDRELLVFVDDLALGWVSASRTVQFVGLSAGSHRIRVRALDGQSRSRTVEATFPSRVIIDAQGLRRAD